ncbi:CDP-glucose 4,6-dehydratase [Herbaspirillum seropedicae]|uniref:CDP-glucose 4,6-dehydratase n=1 Tax=Herbaspirillum seropedicae TaxID=964 RepID=UPI0008481783|nr:CDP-glucose 4,6-dehydratase [Herbaspirillum seropedicae]AON56558.1 dTDP-glucose 4,6-dehydratase [Herbaspirillum seropedicae]MDR6395960.1 CDP-glucose 4,6-dehydratase [Herbaspirillum seropedicae]
MGTLVNDEYLKTFSGRRVLVTGHTGFKGSWLALLLSGLGADVMGYALAPAYPGSHFERLGLAERMRHVEGDVRDLASLNKAVQSFKPEFVFHLAAQALVRESYSDPKSTFDTNVGGSVNLLEAVRACDSVRSLVFVTSDKCYENVEWIWAYRENDALGGRDPYSASKAAAEIVFSSYLRSWFTTHPHLGAASVRAGNVIGGGDWAADRIVPDCIRALVDKQAIVLRNPAATRPWQHVLEPISGYLKLAAYLYDAPHQYEGAWNFGPPVGDARTVLDVAKHLATQFVDGQVVVEASANKLHEANLLQLNSDKARQMLQWSTRWDFEQTLQATGNWYQEVLLQGKDAAEVSLAQIKAYYGGWID